VSKRNSSRFSLVGFAVALVTVGVGTAAGLAFLPVAGTYVGMLAGGVVAGVAVEARSTVESGVAAVLASLGVLVAGALPGSGVVAAVLSLLSIDPVTLLIGVALSFAVGAFGGHFGDDLRDGLTEPLAESSPAPSGQRVDGRSTTADADALTSSDGQRAPGDATDVPRDGGDTDRARPSGELDAADGPNEGAGEESVDREQAEFELEEN
jgi:hypothetical protein